MNNVIFKKQLDQLLRFHISHPPSGLLGQVVVVV